EERAGGGQRGVCLCWRSETGAQGHQTVEGEVSLAACAATGYGQELDEVAGPFVEQVLGGRQSHGSSRRAVLRSQRGAGTSQQLGARLERPVVQRDVVRDEAVPEDVVRP